MKKLKIFIQVIFLMTRCINSSQSAESRLEDTFNKAALKESAAQGDIIAQNRLGEFYIKKRKYNKAFTWCSEAANQGLASAQNLLGLIYSSRGNYAEALKWYQRAAAQDYVIAHINIGIVYYNKEEYVKALNQFKKLAAKGITEGQYYLAKMYDDGPGERQGLPKSREKAASLYRRAAKQGHAAAQYELGGCYLTGHGVEQSYEKAIKWCTLAAEQGYMSAQYHLGLMHALGLGGEQSYKTGLKGCVLAAEQGHKEARTMLEWQSGQEGVLEQDYEKTLLSFSIAVAEINVRAQNTNDFYYEFLRESVNYTHEQALNYVRINSPSYQYKERTAQKELDRLLGKTTWYCNLQ